MTASTDSVAARVGRDEPPILLFDGVVKRYGPLVALDDLLAKSSQDCTDNAHIDMGWMLSEKHLLLAQRDFARAEVGLRELVAAAERPPRQIALVREFLGELYTESCNYSLAHEHLQKAREIAEEVVPGGDVMTEILRRQAQLFLCQGNLDDAKTTALRCISLSRKIGDRYECAAALRVLGETYVAQGRAPRAAAAFRRQYYGRSPVPGDRGRPADRNPRRSRHVRTRQ